MSESSLWSGLSGRCPNVCGIQYGWNVVCWALPTITKSKFRNSESKPSFFIALYISCNVRIEFSQNEIAISQRSDLLIIEDQLRPIFFVALTPNFPLTTVFECFTLVQFWKTPQRVTNLVSLTLRATEIAWFWGSIWIAPTRAGHTISSFAFENLPHEFVFHKLQKLRMNINGRMKIQTIILIRV